MDENHGIASAAKPDFLAEERAKKQHQEESYQARGYFVFREEIPLAVWLDLGLIVVGGVLTQSGTKF